MLFMPGQLWRITSHDHHAHMIRRLNRPGSSATEAPRTLAELRVAAVAGRPHLDCIRRVCTAVDVIKQDWSSGGQTEPPHVLLIESSGLRRQLGGGGPLADDKVERAAELIAWAEREGAATALWETALSRRIMTPTTLMRMAGNVFIADPEAGELLTERLDGRRPLQLPLAAQIVPEKAPGFKDRANQISFLGRWPDSFSGRLKAELEAILDVAAEHGLVVLQSERDSGKAGLPERFSPFVKPLASAADAVEAFADSRVVIGFDPGNEGRLFVPQVTFEALAAGSAVIAPHHTGTRRMFRYSALVVTDGSDAKDQIERVLGSEDAWDEVSALSRRAILHAHTYSHRLATIASAARFRLVPEVEPKAVGASS